MYYSTLFVYSSNDFATESRDIDRVTTTSIPLIQLLFNQYFFLALVSPFQFYRKLNKLSIVLKANGRDAHTTAIVSKNDNKFMLSLSFFMNVKAL